jgi:hypothetical protein
MGTYRREGDSFDQDHNHPERVTEWQDLSRSEKNLALSFLAVVGGTVLLAGYGFAALIHRLLF